MEESLLEKLWRYAKSDFYPLHMPGHKRQAHYFDSPYEIDITEIDGFDNLFHAEGILLEAQSRAARLYGAEETYYLVNGSTCGILAAISASVDRGGRILMARNSHKASYHGVFLNDLHAVYLYPQTDRNRMIHGAVRPRDVEQALEEHRDIQAVLITSPTYDGVVSDIRRIAAAAHRAGAVLIVDEAHGAHFVMHPYFPETALECGADLVINSLHKTMPSLTQTALLHVQGSRTDREKLRHYLGIYQTSSPSYVLMAAMDRCICQMQQEGSRLFGDFAARLERLRAALRRMNYLHLLEENEPGLYMYDYDHSKIIISTERSGFTGPQLAGLLRSRYHLEPEMEAEQYVTAIMTVCDTGEGFARLERALLELDRDPACSPVSGNAHVSSGRNRGSVSRSFCEPEPGAAPEETMTIRAAFDAPSRPMRLADSVGRVSAEYVYLYPPGIPLLVPGERVPDGFPARLAYYRKIGLHVQGLADYDGQMINIVRH